MRQMNLTMKASTSSRGENDRNGKSVSIARSPREEAVFVNINQNMESGIPLIDDINITKFCT